MENEVKERIRQALSVAKRVVFLGGAGVSVASGIPDFRSPNGLYSTRRADGLSYEELLSHDYFFHDPKGFYDFYWSSMVNLEAKPNLAHKALVEYEKHHDLAILTQNIDGLHQLAGSKRVYELHGSTLSYHCIRCDQHFDRDELNHTGVPMCPHCGGLIKPDVTLYGESLPEEAFMEGIAAVNAADVMIVGGTSLRVYPFAGIVRYFHGRLSVLINAEPTPLDEDFDIVIREDIGKTLSEVLG